MNNNDIQKPSQASLRIKPALILLACSLCVGVMVAGVAWLLEASLHAGAGAWAVIGLAFAALVATSLVLIGRAEARPSNVADHTGAEVAEVRQELDLLLSRLTGNFSTQHVQAGQELEQVHGLLNDAAEKLVSSFTSLESHTRQQQTLALHLADRNRGERIRATRSRLASKPSCRKFPTHSRCLSIPAVSGWSWWG